MVIPVPGEQFGEAVDWMAPGHTIYDVGEVSLRIEAVEFGAFQHGIEDCGAFAAGIGSKEQEILAGNGNYPFILPMSGRSWKFTTGITPISAGKLWCAA